VVRAVVQQKEISTSDVASIYWSSYRGSCLRGKIDGTNLTFNKGGSQETYDKSAQSYEAADRNGTLLGFYLWIEVIYWICLKASFFENLK